MHLHISQNEMTYAVHDYRLYIYDILFAHLKLSMDHVRTVLFFCHTRNAFGCFSLQMERQYRSCREPSWSCDPQPQWMEWSLCQYSRCSIWFFFFLLVYYRRLFVQQNGCLWTGCWNVASVFYLVFGLQYRRQPKLPNLLASTRLVQGVIGFPSIVEILVGN